VENKLGKALELFSLVPFSKLILNETVVIISFNMTTSRKFRGTPSESRGTPVENH
jgi:hypothetical protein